MNRKFGFRAIWPVFILAATAACTLGVGLTQGPSFPSPIPLTPGFPTSGGPTLLPTAGLTLAPTLAIPTDTPVPPTEAPTEEPTAAATVPVETAPRLTMGAGRTAVYADSSVTSGGSATYLVGALAGQYMMVMINSANQYLYVRIQSPDGTYLVTPDQKLNYWQGNLPANGDYHVSVIAPGDSGGNFTLGVTIPVRVVFKAGAVSASSKASVGAHGITTYLLRALSGQTMTVKVTSPSSDVFLTIYGLQDGNPYVRSVTGQTSASFKLPSTQDYVIQCVSTGEAAEDISVDFTVK